MKKFLNFCVFLAIIGMTHQVNAAGFALIEQSVSGMGTAYAGSAATAEDATTVWFNPAGMTRFCRRQIVLGGQVVFPRANFHNEDSRLSPGLGGAPLTGGNGGQIGRDALIPSVYYVQPLCGGLVAGIGINGPFGLVSSYESDWVGRYYARYSKLRTVNINPAIAWQVCDNFSIAGGFSAQYIKARLTNSIDFGGILASLGAPVAPQSLDGKADLHGDSWGWGYNLGLLWDITPCLTAGVAYRSEITQKLKGDVKYEGVPQALAGIFVDTDIQAKVVLPQSVSLSAVYRLTCAWDVMADVTWTKWDSIQDLVIDYDSNQSNTILPLKLDNSFRYSLGTTYIPCDNLKLRFGVAYDSTPTPNPEFRTPRIPESNRFWTALGFGYDWNCVHFDVGYAHLFVEKFSIDKSDALGTGERDFYNGYLRGKFRHVHIDIVGAQVVYNF